MVAPGKPNYSKPFRLASQVLTGIRNLGVKAKNKVISRKKFRPTYAMIESRKPRKLGDSLFYDPNVSGRCSAYATRIAQKFKESYVKGDAWDLAAKNHLVYEVLKEQGGISKGNLRGMMREGVIRPGTILGIYVAGSPNNKPGRNYSHVIVYIGENVFWHNYGGPSIVTFKELFKVKDGKREFIPIAVIHPKKQ
jgi:hypothetical protein